MAKFRGSHLVAAGILLSRVAGLIRTVAISTVLGATDPSDAFFFAMRVPNFLQNLLGEGSLSASFVPVYAQLLETGKTKEANALARGVVSFLALATSVLVLLLVLLAGPIVRVFSDFEGEKRELAIDLTQITSVGLGFLVIAAWCLGVLNSHRSFFLSYVSPVIWNIAQIALLLVARAAGWSVVDSAVGLAFAVVVGSALQLGVQVPKVIKLVPELRPTFKRSPRLTDVIHRFAPAVGARGVVQVSSLLDTYLAAEYLAGQALSLFFFAFTLYLLPISLFGVSVAVSELTEMSRKSDSLSIVAERVTDALRRVAVPAGFFTVAYLTTSRQIVDALFGWPSRLFPGDDGVPLFSDSNVTAVAIVLAAFSVGLPAVITARIIQNTLYALGDVKGPARVALIRLAVGVVAAVLFMFQLDILSVDGTTIIGFDQFPDPNLLARRSGIDGQPNLGAAGLALGAAVAAWTEFVLLRVLLKQKLGLRIVTGWFWSITLASVLSGTTMFLIGKVSIVSPVNVVVVISSGAIVYAGVLWVLGIRPRGKVGFRS